MAKDVNNIIYKIEVDTKTGLINIDGLTKGFMQADKAVLKLQKDIAKGTSGATQSMKGLGDATGSATSATMELSRVISDAPYGIRGMANNITQLVSQMGTASVKAGGLREAIKLMIKQMMGPLGVVFAITAVVSAFDFFYGANKKAENSVDDLSEAIGGTAGATTKLKTYVDIVRTSNKETSEYKNALEKLKKEGYDPATQSLDNFIKKQLQLITVRAKSKVIENRLNELFTERVEYETKLREKRLKIEDLEIRKSKETNKVRRDRIQNNIDYVKSQMKAISSDEEYNRLQKELIELTKTQLSLEPTKVEGGGDTTKKISPFKTPEDLELEVKSNMSAMDKLAKQTELINLKSEEKARLATAQSEEDKIFIKEEYALKKLDIDENYEKKAMEAKKLAEIQSATESNIAYQRKIDKDLAAFEAKLRKEGKALTDAEAKMLQDAKKVASDKKANANQELMDTVVDIEEQYSKLFPFWEQMAAARRAAIGTDKKIDTDNEFTLEEGIQQFMKAQSAMTEFLDGEYQRQLTIEQNKTNSINNELRERLNNENLASGERKRIQLQIARNDEALRKKQEQIEKKRFKLNKAANIAQATISTYLAANKVLAETKGGTIARFVAMAATISSGLLNVAAIARQKFQSSAGATTPAGALGGGGSGGGNDRSFNFNLAGASRENQLANTLQGRFNQPLQAYVVSRDITNQQQLDEEITSSASFG